MSILRRDFGPGQLQPLCQECGISGVVSVQARQTVAETAWLLKIANAEPWIQAVVGWVPLIQADVEHEIEQFVGSAKFKGVRHVVQDEPEDDFILGSDFNRGIRTLKNYGLVYDLLIYGRHLSNTIAFVDSHPDQPFILDHIAKPSIDVDFDQRWADQMIELGRRDNVVGCKFSGVVTEVRLPVWDTQLLQPYWDTALRAFGADRLMFGSDWPVCLLRTSYTDWFRAVETLASGLSPDEQSQFWAINALRAYRIQES